MTEGRAVPRVVVLGAGPAGVGAAFRLRGSGRAQVTVLEQAPVVGGNAGSFDFGGQAVDYGSHRLHPACDPTILADIRALLGADLLTRPRHGRIRLRGRWLRFPLRPLDLARKLDPAFTLGVTRDMLRGSRRRAGPEGDSFASVMLAQLGPTICRDFYFPYARKIWGREPAQISPTQARRRVSASSFGKLLRKVMSALPGVRRPTTGVFFYPRHGFGQISGALAGAAREAGAALRLGERVVEVERAAEDSADGGRWVVRTSSGTDEHCYVADMVWSTIPVTVLTRLIRPAPPPEVLRAAGAMSFRSMLLVYLELPVGSFTEFDAHYFPEPAVRITRLSEPRHYAARREPSDRTVVCAELPASAGDGVWEMDDRSLAALVAEDLERVGLALPATPSAILVKRLPYAYPIYERGYEGHFRVLDEWIGRQDGLLSFGRQGLFAHDNTHHALFMAYRAADCLDGGTFDVERWRDFRAIFETHVVED